MPGKRPIPKIKLKRTTNRDILKKIAKDEKIKGSNLFKIFSHNHQKLHQLYSKKDNHTYNDDDEVYTGMFTQMKKYNEICKKNIKNYFIKKDENKNFLKQYLDFKKMNKEMCNDEINNLYGNLLHKYGNKNFYFSDKFLSGEKLFQGNGLLVRKKNEIEDFYIGEIKKNGKNKKSMRDLLYINNIFDRLEQKKVQYNSLQKNPFLKISDAGRRKSCAADIIDKYKRTHAYKKLMKEQAMNIAHIVRMKQKEIEEDEKYIENISKLIEIQENSKEKDNTFYSIRNNPISLIKHNTKNTENDNSNTLFIINRYGKKNLSNFKTIYNENTNLLNKNKSAINIYSTLIKEKKDTANSTFMNNIKDTKSTFLSRNTKKVAIPRNSIKTAIDYTDYKLDNLNSTSGRDYIMIDDTSNKQNIKKLKKISSFKQDKKYSFNSTGKLKIHNIKRDIKNDNNENNDNLSTISLFNKTNFYNISSYSNLSNKKAKQNQKKEKIKNIKSTLSVSQGKINFNEKVIKDFIMNEKNFDKKELRWDLYKKFIGLKYKLQYNNNHKLENFCNTFTSLPKIVNDKLNKTFHLDEQIKKVHHKYIQRIMEHKIRDFNKEEDESII